MRIFLCNLKSRANINTSLKKHLLLIDNYDSFTYTIGYYFECLNINVTIVKNDAITIAAIEKMAPDFLVISPGPNGPLQAGISLQVISYFQSTIPILGICLGHQCLAHVFGGEIYNAPEVMHGKTSKIMHNQQKLFRNLPTSFSIMRYHSLAIDPKTLPACFIADAWVDDTIMAISHRSFPLFGIQFHPESILTEHGLALLANFINHEY